MPPAPAAPVPRAPKRWAWAVAALAFAGHFQAARDLAPGWDEGYTWDRLETLAEWLRILPQSPARAFRTDVLERHWRFSKEEPDGHGPAYALLSGAGHALASWALAPPLSYRVGSAALFAFAAACLFRTLAPRWGAPLGALTPLLLAAQPRLVPEIAFGIVDGPLLSFACLAWCGWASGGAAWRCGVPLGAALACKLTGWFLLPALFLDAGRGAGSGLLRWSKTAGWALATTFALNVGWWPQPLAGPVRFFRSNLSRAESIPIGNLYCGELYPFALPWHNTLVWTAVAVPPLVVALGLAGAAWAVRGLRQPRDGDLGPGLLLLWGTFMVLRALPQAPGHDGTRQLALAFLFLALLAGYAAARLCERWPFAGTAALALAFGTSLYDCVRHHPLELSYYSPAVGGLPGIVGRFEPTYFWDAATPDVLEFLNRETPPGRTVMFATNPRNWEYLHRWRKLVPPPHGPGIANEAIAWYVLQHRPSQLKPRDHWLLAHATPGYERRLFGVPLVGVYSADDLRRATAAVAGAAP